MTHEYSHTHEVTVGDDPGARAGAPRTPRYRFRRARDERMIAGLCGGAAKLFGIDPTIVRVALVAATLIGFGLGFVLYLVCWIVVPEE
ncbi:PspC domain-containing protein [Actinopolyspora mortivallis]|uniref:PspC domain-containing protein n=1 Tax=Actinopolyspora mortivallis TaxID=33906 RepID=A0A2T0GWS1_ACTMO|nr:PspC domain-containing protein [Actinopolyspora mortivallis]PRW63559.1 PspC domain-containing protein [Actinopolyspora mortivallis]